MTRLTVQHEATRPAAVSPNAGRGASTVFVEDVDGNAFPLSPDHRRGFGEHAMRALTEARHDALLPDHVTLDDELCDATQVIARREIPPSGGVRGVQRTSDGFVCAPSSVPTFVLWGTLTVAFAVAGVSVLVVALPAEYLAALGLLVVLGTGVVATVAMMALPWWVRVDAHGIGVGKPNTVGTRYVWDDVRSVDLAWHSLSWLPWLQRTELFVMLHDGTHVPVARWFREATVEQVAREVLWEAHDEGLLGEVTLGGGLVDPSKPSRR